MILPPGRRRLATRPSSTGSPMVEKTIGIVLVAAFAATAAGWSRRQWRRLGAEPIRLPRRAVDRIDPRPNGIRLSHSGPRHSRFRSSLGEGAHTTRHRSGDALLRKPITGSACCARARRGQVAAAPPSSVMNSRRFTDQYLRCLDRKDSTPRWGRRLLRCGISTRLMTAVGHVR